MRHFFLQSSPDYGWHTGLTRDGRQAPMGIDWNALVCLLFDEEGRYMECVERFFTETGEPTDTAVTRTPFHLVKGAEELLTQRFSAWKNEVIQTEESISVCEFFHAIRHIRIEEEPEHFQEALDEADEEERPLIEEDIHRWRQDGDFVFWWNEDYYCNADGTVHSS